MISKVYFHDHPILTCEEVGVWRSSRSRPPPDSPHTRGGDSSLQGGGAGPTLCVTQPTLAVYLPPPCHAPWSPVVCAAWKLSIINLSLRQIYQISFSLQLIDKEVILHPVLFRDQDSLAETMRRKINWKFSILELGC